MSLIWIAPPGLARRHRLADAVMCCREYLHLHAVLAPHDVDRQRVNIDPRMIAEQLILAVRVDNIQVIVQNGISSSSSISAGFGFTASIVAPGNRDFTLFVNSPALLSSHRSTIAATSAIE